jgi:pentatricopeptide repeat protein
VTEHLFHRISLPDTYTWNVLMTGYSENGYYSQAIECFESMKLHDVPLDVVTFISCLKACGSLQATSTGLTMHSEIIKLGFLEEDPEVGNVLVDMYVKCGLLEKAQKVFGRLLDRSIVSWTSLIKGYLEHERADKAVECFEKMQLDGIVPDSVAFVAGLQACGSLGAVKKGEELYIEMEQRGLLQQDAICGKAVVDMYAKCCCLEKAQQVFYRLPFRDVVAWTTLMAAYTQLGKSASVFPMYHRMVEEGIKPDEVVFTVTLAACSQMGLFGKFETYLETMTKDYGIAPTHKHFMCAVDLFSFTGQLENAFRTIRKMPCCHTRRAWNNLLCACRYSGNIVIGRHAFEHVS